MNPEQVKQLIEQALPGAEVMVESGDNTHYVAVVISPAFEGKSRLEQHRMVYRALGGHLGDIHALSLNTYAPTAEEF